MPEWPALAADLFLEDNDRAWTRVYLDIVIRSFAFADTISGVTGTDTSTSIRARAEATVVADGSATRVLSRALLDDRALRDPQWGADVRLGALKRAKVLARARPLGERTTAVVLAPSVGAGLLHELIGHGLEDDNLSSGSTYAEELLSRRFPAQLRMRDSGIVPGGFGSLAIDDEGHPATEVILLEDGRVCGALTSYRSSRRSERPRSGNARRQSYAYLPLPRATNTIADPGDDDPVQLREPTQDGVLLVHGWASGEVDVASGQFAFTAADAEYVEPSGGSQPLRDVMIGGSAAEVLSHMSGVGSDWSLDSAMCGKGPQTVPVGFGSPTLRLDDVTWRSQ